MAHGLAVFLILAAGACSGRRQVVIMGPPLDANQAALRAERATALQEPSRIVFSWSLSEQGVRVSGRGVARVEPPYHARLDLFLSNGETAARAAMVDDDLRIPSGVPDGILPPSHLMWGTVGVFRPGMGIGLAGGQRLEDGGVQLEYRLANGDQVVYHLDANRRVRDVEVSRSGSVIQRLTVDSDGDAFPSEVVYRDLTSFRELRITRESVEHVEPYPPDIWIP